MSNYNTEKEVWKDVVGYEGFYKISNKARIISYDRISKGRDGKTRSFKGRELKTFVSDKDGYVRVGLTVDGVCKTYTLHRLVMNSFLGVNEGLEVNHVDEDRSNNSLSNLEWVTPKVNVNYRYEGHSEEYVRKSIFRLIEYVGLQDFKKIVSDVIK